MFELKALKTVAAAGALLLIATGAQAVTIDFVRITDNSPIDGSSQLQAEATDFGSAVHIAFTVLSGDQGGANIAEIYFSDLLGLFTPPPAYVEHIGNVAFEFGGVNNPGELPGAGGADPAFVTTAGLVAENSGNNATGITVGESLTISLNFVVGFDFTDFLAALEEGDFRIGLHVRSLGEDGEESDGFVNTPSVVPVPAAGFLLIGALGGLAALRRRRKA
jgi:hypothetical protein